MLRGGCTDPGIMPRQKEIPLWNPKRTSTRKVVNGHFVNYVFCYSCFIFRPPRTSHCASCDNCVQRFDHHCIWLGTCIGMRNYKFFFYFVVALNLNALFQIGYAIYLIVFQCKSSNRKERFNTLILAGMSCIIFYDVMFIVFFLGKLVCLHTWLVFINQTFYEYFKKKFKGLPANPFFK